MRAWLGLIVGSLAIVFVASYVWTQRHQVTTPTVITPPAAAATADGATSYDEEEQARGMVTISGPLADYMTRQQPHSVERTPQPVSRKPTAADLVGDSPVGTSTPILHKTFTVAKAANLPFEIPAHAANPKLHGSYHALILQSGTASPDGTQVEFLLLNEQQYADVLNQRPADALFSADGAHDQEINVSMPPTLTDPMKYFLVFRNSSQSGKAVAVQADFRVDF